MVKKVIKDFKYSDFVSIVINTRQYSLPFLRVTQKILLGWGSNFC